MIPARLIPAVSRAVLGSALVFAGVAKLLASKQFFLALLDYGLPLPDPLLRFTAVTLPWLEVLCGLLLCVREWRAEALSVTLGLTAIFVVVSGQAWARGLRISCGCFGSHEVGYWSSPALAFARALGLLVVAAWLLRRPRDT